MRLISTPMRLLHGQLMLALLGLYLCYAILKRKMGFWQGVTGP